jgi:hypothetical protein
MDTDRARSLYEQYAASVAYVSVELPNGDASIGSAFHVGDGVWITARHVLENNRICRISTTESWHKWEQDPHGRPGFGVAREGVSAGELTISGGPYFLEDAQVDVAAFKASGVVPPAIPLGGHLDDWLGTELVLTECLVLGYPPIPQSRAPLLVASKAEINAVVDDYFTPHPHFVVSTMARGGFSGGVALSENNFALGVITKSLNANSNPVELGYLVALTVEPIWTLLGQHRLVPVCQKGTLNNFFNAEFITLFPKDHPAIVTPRSGVVQSDPGRTAWMELVDLGQEFRIQISFPSADVQANAYLKARDRALSLGLTHTAQDENGLTFTRPGPEVVSLEQMRAVGEAATEVMRGAGYEVHVYGERDPTP